MAGKQSGTRYEKKTGQPTKISFSMDAPVASNEAEALRRSSPGRTLHDLAVIGSFLRHPPLPFEVRRFEQREAQARLGELLMWSKNERLDDRLIVVVDKRCRLAAIGWPHKAHCYIVERMVGDRFLVHEHARPIIHAGLWSLISVVASMNSADLWGSKPHMSVTALFQQMNDIGERLEASASGSA